MFFTRITNEGSSFIKALCINKNDENSFIGDFDASGKYVYIIWNDASLDGGHVFFIRSANNGASFDNINDFGPSNLPFNQLDTISNNVYASGMTKMAEYYLKQAPTMGLALEAQKH